MTYRIPLLSVVLLALLVAACATTPDAPTGERTANVADLHCDPVTGIERLPDDSLLLFGELHGTDLAPAAVGDVACHLARRRGGVVVGLEISHREQAALDAYLASDGAHGDRARLLAGEFWTDPYQDGRRSIAMLELVETLRRLRAGGREVSIVAFDPLPDVALGDREEHLARRLAAARTAHPHRPFLAFAGNLHPRTARGTPWDADFLPMGARLVATGVEVVPIDVRHAGGAAWMCSGSTAESCGPREVGGAGEPREEPALELFAAPEEATGYVGALWVGRVTASPPAGSSTSEIGGEPTGSR